jgi:hypothetical protein
MIKEYTPQKYRLDRDLVNRADGMRINIDYCPAHSPEKAQLLRQAGIRNLRIKSGASIPVEICNPGRIGAAFKKTFYSAQRRLNRLTPEQRRRLQGGLAVVFA